VGCPDTDTEDRRHDGAKHQAEDVDRGVVAIQLILREDIERSEDEPK